MVCNIFLYTSEFTHFYHFRNTTVERSQSGKTENIIKITSDKLTLFRIFRVCTESSYTNSFSYED